MTTTTNKVLPVALVAALLGGTVGAFVMRDGKKTPEVAVASEQAKANDVSAADANKTDDPNALLNQEIADETKNMTDEERAAFRAGFDEGVDAARDNELTGARTAARTATRSNVVYRTRAARQAPRRVYYDYGQTKGRSFWQKHRDKLTVAMGTGGRLQIRLRPPVLVGRKGRRRRPRSPPWSPRTRATPPSSESC